MFLGVINMGLVVADKKPHKPRMMLTLTPEVDALLRDISALSGVAPASYVTSLLVGMLPYLQQAVKALEKANQGKLEYLDMLQNALFQAQADSSQIGMEIGEMRKLAKTKGLRRKKVDGSE